MGACISAILSAWGFPSASTSTSDFASASTSTSYFASASTATSTSTSTVVTPTTNYSTSTAANRPTNSCYDIFLNHRGADTKSTFASYLYRRLVLHGFRIFWDKEEMQPGDTLTSQIQAAIESASVHVAIFSPRYAESKWCLEELQLMVESGKTIIPVFYNVQPTELRWTHGDGVYARALRILEKKRNDGQPRYMSSTVENWRAALSKVADISGLELERFNGDEGDLLDHVVKSVSQELNKTRFDVAEHPTGLDEKIKDFEKVLLQQQSGRAQVIGIVGLGGIGKTTLVQEFFNRKSSQYDRSCFLCDVRDKNKSSLESLQKKLFISLTQMLNVQIECVSEGREKLNSISNCQALVILDDVDRADQLDALLRPIRTVLQSNSLVLITSRDRDVLRRSKVEESSIYKLTGLNSQHSRELFCLHAFTQRHPLPGFEHLVDKYLKACNGLPLSLKVFGALVYGNGKSFWKNQLDRLEQILPYEIKSILQISYDTLQRDEKQMFLDIACFLIGKKKHTAITIWDGFGWKGSLAGFQNLQNKNLVDVDIQNEIRMHDHLRDLGRDLAKDPGLPRRICGSEDIELLQQSSVVTVVRGISMGRTECEDQSFSGCKMKNLRLLDIDSREDLLNSILNEVQSPNLMWLRWNTHLHSSLPSWIPMRNLRVLEVFGEHLQTLWQEESQIPLQLRELQIDAPLRDIPKSIGLLKHLERILIFNGYFHVRVEKLPAEFCQLRSLKHLEICSWIRSLPESFGNLINLQNINLSRSSALKRLPDSFGNLINLQHLNLSDSSSLERLPVSFGNLINLQHINLSNCSALKRLPDSFGNLARLKYLDLSSCYNLTVSREALGNISTLEYLSLIGCKRIEVLPSQLAHQRSLEILYLCNGNLIDLPSDIGELRNFKKLALSGCPKLKRLPDSLGWLNQLTELTLCYCYSLVEVGTLPDALITLELIKCAKLRKIKGLCSLTKLQILCITHCQEVEELPSIETLVSLEEIHASECVKLRRIRGLARLTKLRILNVSNCSELKELVGLEHLNSLELLDVYGCCNLQFGEGVDPRCIKRIILPRQ